MENKNVFEGAKFGDKFVTRNGNVAIYTNEDKYAVFVLIYGYDIVFVYHLTGEVIYPPNKELDIVSRYRENIDEKRLNDVAEDYVAGIPEAEHDENYDAYFTEKQMQEAYKEGFRAAMNI